ncbi:MAG: hypothetical protein KAH32_08360, partial [Chlamydiia bacterium]|nr:hypothetical protein [Chlamydiia bacterium]
MRHLFLTAIIVITTIIGSNAQEKDPNYSYGYTNSDATYKYGEIEKVHSKVMDRDLPVLVFTPKSYSKKGDKLPVVYLLHGTIGLNIDAPLEEKKLRELYNPDIKIQEAADYYNVIIVAPLVGDTYYLDSPVIKEMRFSTYVGEELPKYIDSKYNTISNRDSRYLAGFSMGGYGAVSLLCRYPDTFSVALNRSGVMNLSALVDDLDWDDNFEPINIMLGNYWDNPKTWHLNSCFNLVNHIRHRDDVAIV